MNKPKIKIVGVGHTGKILVENFSSEKVDLLSIANQDSKANPNDNIEVIELTRSNIITIEEALSLCSTYEGQIDRLNKLLSLIKENDKLYHFFPYNSGCIQHIGWSGIKLKRDGKTIDSFKYTNAKRCSN